MKNIVQLLLIGSLIALSILVVPSCAGSSAADVGTDSNTHWLSFCTSDSDCGSLVCRCGSCTKSCSDVAACGAFAAHPACEPSCSESAAKVCTATCSVASDCPRGGAGFSCRSGECVADGGPDAGASTTCPATFTEGEACNTSATDCYSACVDGFQLHGGCSDGQWGVDKGIHRCGHDAGIPKPDASSRLDAALPDGAALPDAAACAPMDIGPSLLPCVSIAGYFWDGSACETVICSCSGKDCGGIYETVDDCNAARVECIQTAAKPCLVSSDCGPSGEGIGAFCVSGKCVSEDLEPYVACKRDADCVVHTDTCCGACSENPNAFVAVSNVAAYETRFPLTCTADCVACFDDAGVPRTHPNWLHARCDATLGCYLQQDPH